MRRRRFVYFFLFIVFLLSVWGCDKKENKKQQAMKEIWQQCKDILSMTYEKDENLSSTDKYGLGSDWIFSDNRIETLYKKGFFFLFRIESSFTNKNNDELKIIISSKCSCSGVPPHFVLIERSHFEINDKTGEPKFINNEVLEGGMLTLAPTKQDDFSDVLYWAVKMDKQLEEFLVTKGLLTPQQLIEFIRIQNKNSMTSLDQALIEEGIFSAEEWMRIKRQFWAEKKKGKLPHPSIP